MTAPTTNIDSDLLILSDTETDTNTNLIEDTFSLNDEKNNDFSNDSDKLITFEDSITDSKKDEEANISLDDNTFSFDLSTDKGEELNISLGDEVINSEKEEDTFDTNLDLSLDVDSSISEEEVKGSFDTIDNNFDLSMDKDEEIDLSEKNIENDSISDFSEEK
jgi:hypothetical protein